MSRKMCPLGFFSFFINKTSAQAGGAQYCVESQCQFWEELYEDGGQCAILSISESLRAASESLSVIADSTYSHSKGKRLPIAEGDWIVEENPPQRVIEFPNRPIRSADSNNNSSPPAEESSAVKPAEAISGILGGFMDRMRTNTTSPPITPVEEAKAVSEATEPPQPSSDNKSGVDNIGGNYSQ